MANNSKQPSPERYALIRDALESLVHHVPRIDLFFGMLEYLTVLLQEPLLFGIWHKKEDNEYTCLDVFLRDPSYLAKYGRVSPSEQIKAMIAEFEQKTNQDEHLVPLAKTSYCISIYAFPSLEQDTWSPQVHVQWTQWIRELFSDAALSDKFTVHLSSSLARWMDIRTKGKVPALQGRELSQEKVARLLAPLSRALDSVCLNLRFFDEAQEDDGTAAVKAPELYFMVRTFTREKGRFKKFFPYDVRMLLLSQFRRVVSTLFTPSQAYIQALQDPEDEWTRTLADYVFSNELLFFGTKAHVSKLNVASKARERQRLIDEVQGELIPEESSFIAFPVHVCNSPWIVVYRICDAEFKNDWNQGYRFCRTGIRGLGSLIREESKKIYLELVRTVIFENFESRLSAFNDRLNRINEQLEELSMVTPFPKLALKPFARPITTQKELEEQKVLVANDRGAFVLELSGNDYFAVSIHDSPLTADAIYTFLHKEMLDFNRYDTLNYSSLLAYSAHMLETPLDVLRSTIRRKKYEAALVTTGQISSLLEIFKDLRKGSVKGSLLSVGDLRLFLNEELKRWVAHCIDGDICAQECREAMESATFAALPRGLNGAEPVLSFKRYIPPILDGIVSNAARYMNKESPLFAVDLSLDDDGRVLLLMTNSMRADINKQETVNFLNHNKDAGLGCSLLHWITQVLWKSPEMAAWYRAPLWRLTEDESALQVEIPMGKVDYDAVKNPCS